MILVLLDLSATFDTVEHYIDIFIIESWLGLKGMVFKEGLGNQFSVAHLICGLCKAVQRLWEKGGGNLWKFKEFNNKTKKIQNESKDNSPSRMTAVKYNNIYVCMFVCMCLDKVKNWLAKKIIFKQRQIWNGCVQSPQCFFGQQHIFGKIICFQLVTSLGQQDFKCYRNLIPTNDICLSIQEDMTCICICHAWDIMNVAQSLWIYL